MNHLFHPYAVETFGSCGTVVDNMLKAFADRFRNMTTIVSNGEVLKNHNESGFGESNIYQETRVDLLMSFLISATNLLYFNVSANRFASGYTIISCLLYTSDAADE